MQCVHCKRVRKIVGKGFCNACYQRWRKAGTAEYRRLGKKSKCQIDDCGGRAVSHGLCDKHRLRLRKTGTTDEPVQWGAVSKHPLRHTWKWITRYKDVRGGIAPEWERDFLQFAMDVGERPSQKHKLFAADESKPIGPGNFIWKRAVTERVVGEDEKTYFARAQRVYRAVRQEAFAGYGLKKTYGLTYQQYMEMVGVQGGLCAICGQGEKAKTKGGEARQLAVDHCHSTGAIRGLLCGSCNRGLGYFSDDIKRLRSAIAYLERHAAKKKSA